MNKNLTHGSALLNFALKCYRGFPHFASYRQTTSPLQKVASVWNKRTASKQVPGPIFPVLVFSAILPSWNHCIHHERLTTFLKSSYWGNPPFPALGRYNLTQGLVPTYPTVLEVMARGWEERKNLSVAEGKYPHDFPPPPLQDVDVRNNMLGLPRTIWADLHWGKVFSCSLLVLLLTDLHLTAKNVSLCSDQWKSSKNWQHLYLHSLILFLPLLFKIWR